MNRREPRLLHDNVTEQILPGIGRRYDMAIEDGHLAVVIHHSGRRDLYLLAKPDAEPSSVLTLTDMRGAHAGRSARRRVLQAGGRRGDGGGDRRPAHRLGHAAARTRPAPDKSIAELEIRSARGMTVAAIVRGHMPIVAPEPDEVLRAGDRLIVVGRREDLAGFIRHVVGEPVGNELVALGGAFLAAGLLARLGRRVGPAHHPVLHGRRRAVRAEHARAVAGRGPARPGTARRPRAWSCCLFHLGLEFSLKRPGRRRHAPARRGRRGLPGAQRRRRSGVRVRARLGRVGRHSSSPAPSASRRRPSSPSCWSSCAGWPTRRAG